jgi:hypothetical protein
MPGASGATLSVRRHARLAVRWEYRADIHHGFLTLACCLICWRCLKRFAA